MIKLVAAALLVSGSALAQTAPTNPPMAMPMPAHGADSPSTAAYRQAMQHMMTGMDIPYSGDADRDFVNGMLPHHQGAIDMARVELQYGHDPKMKQIARNIIASQTREQAAFRQWQQQHPAKP
jgi:uncharacterized protein (DUF305 family)